MAKLILSDDSSSIEEESDLEFLKQLDKELSFKVQGAEYTKAYKGYYRGGQFVKWDGITRLLKRNLSFAPGLTQRVVDFYQAHGKHLQIVDKKTPKTSGMSVDLSQRLQNLGFETRSYQLQTTEIIKDRDSGIIRMATGAGKTICIALMTASLGKKTIVYVIGKSLLYQVHELFTQLFDQEIGIVGDGNCEIRDINVVSVWTVGQALGLEKSKVFLDTVDSEKVIDKEKYKDILDLMRTAKVNFWDECHLAACSTIQEIAKNSHPEHVYGLSASPYRDDGQDMLIESIFGSTILDISASYLIRNNYLVKPYIKFIEVPPLGKKVPKKYPTVYKNYIIENETRNQKIVTGANRLVEQGFKPLVLFTRLNHGKKLFKEISKDLPTMMLSGKDSKETRIEAKKKITSGEIKCLVASTIFDIGVDIPALSGLIIAGGGKSSVRALQRIGRVIRKAPDKDCAAVIDFLDRAPYFLKNHSMVRRRVYSSEEEFEVIWPT